MSKNKLK